jgi:hypothetical protein
MEMESTKRCSGTKRAAGVIDYPQSVALQQIKLYSILQQ